MVIKLNCQCGTRYSFDVEPVNGRMPIRVCCPSCGTDGTDAANELLAKVAPAPAAPQQPQFTIISASDTAAASAPAAAQSGVQEKPKLRVSGAKTVSAPAHEPAVSSAPGAEMCSRHPGIPSAAQCTVCKKPICPECMSTFGYLCSVGCRYQAEQQGIKVPKYKLQKRSVESREFRKGAVITVAVIAVIFSLIAAYYWYEFTGSKPKLNYTLNVGNEQDVHSQFLGDNQLLIVSSDRAYVRDIKTDKDVWSTDIKDVPPARPQVPNASDDEAATTPAQAKTPTGLARKISAAIAAQSAAKTGGATATTRRTAKLSRTTAAVAAPDDTASAASDDEDMSYGFSGFGDYGRPRVFVDADNIWICFNARLKCLDRKTGQVKSTIPITGRLVQFTPSDSNILLVSAPSATHRLLTRIEIPAGNVTTNEVIVPRPAKRRVVKGELPVNVLPTAGVLMHQELQDRENFRPQVIQTSSEFFASGDNLVELRVRLVEVKTTSVETMKKKGPSKINGELSASTSAKAVAEEVFNDIKRSNTGGFKEVDESTYLVTLRRYAGKDSIDWTNTVSGVPLFFAFKTVDVIVANKHLIALDKQNKKLFEATLSYGLSDAFLQDTHSAPPGFEMENVLYFYDQGLLTAYELPTGNVRWRLPSVISCVQVDNKGMFYVDTSSAAPEDIQYSEQIKLDKIDPIILKVDPKTGKTIWKSVNHGQQCFFTGKYLFTTSSFMGGLGLGNALREALDMSSHGPSYFHIYRLDPDNGDLIWDYGNNKDGTPSQTDFQDNKIALNYGNEIRVLKFLQLF